MPATDDEPDAELLDGFTTLALPMGGMGTPRLPVPVDPASTASADVQLVRLRDVDIGGLTVPCYGFDPT